MASLRRVQEFSANDLIQQEKFGQYKFESAVEPALKIVNLYKQLPASTIELLPDTELETIKSQSDSLYQLFQQILDFDMEGGDIKNRQSQFTDKLTEMYQRHFSRLYPIIAYSVAKTVDFNRLEDQGRATIQRITDQTSDLMKEFDKQRDEIARILDEVRATAAERGVSQEAEYFKTLADNHSVEAQRWQELTRNMAIAVAAYGVFTLFIHKIPFFSPSNTFETVQLVASKLIIFFVLVYMLSICARNFLSNRHNEIVNRHRQTSLTTYSTLVAAGGTPEARDAILNHAAASVYQLHDTGFTKQADGGTSSSSSFIGMLSRAPIPTSQSGG